MVLGQINEADNEEVETGACRERKQQVYHKTK